VALARLDEATLAGSPAFEVATRARQAGVPAYAIAAHSALDSFHARILDLQLVLRAGSSRSLSAAGRRLAAVV
jgi:glycerate 2-kinase